jgi:hypothetical protein
LSSERAATEAGFRCSPGDCLYAALRMHPWAEVGHTVPAVGTPWSLAGGFRTMKTCHRLESVTFQCCPCSLIVATFFCVCFPPSRVCVGALLLCVYCTSIFVCWKFHDDVEDMNLPGLLLAPTLSCDRPALHAIHLHPPLSCRSIGEKFRDTRGMALLRLGREDLHTTRPVYPSELSSNGISRILGIRAIKLTPGHGFGDLVWRQRTCTASALHQPAARPLVSGNLGSIPSSPTLFVLLCKRCDQAPPTLLL